MLDRAFEAIGKFSYRRRHLVAILFVTFFLLVAILQSFAPVSYYYADYNEVIEVFPEDDTLVIVYKNADEGAMAEVVQWLNANERITSVQSYATTLGAQMTADELAELAGIDATFIEMLFYIRQNGLETEGMTVLELINFVSSDELMGNPMLQGQMDEETKSQLLQAKTLMNGIADGTLYGSSFYAELLGVDLYTMETIFRMLGVTQIGIEDFVSPIMELADTFPNLLDDAAKEALWQLKSLIRLAKSTEVLSPAELATAFPVESEMLNETTLTLLCIMRDAGQVDMAGETLALYDFFTFIADEILPSSVFSPFFDEDTKAQMTDAKQMMAEGKAQLVGPHYSRLIATLNYEMESKAIYNFYEELETKLQYCLLGDYYLIGNSAMSSELSKTFRTEYTTISVITAIAIFIVVTIAFRKFSVPVLLISIIECAVFVTTSVMTVGNIDMYFIALIIVQCVLMGSMVDYGILFTNYYVEIRRSYTVEEALPIVLKRSIRAIAISAVILIMVTFVCSFIIVGAVASILATICIGACAALLLVVFVLPSLLAIFDKTICKGVGEQICA